MSPGVANETATIRTAQVWVELTSADPEARSALAVARARLEAGKELTGLRRLRLIELDGALPARERIEELLHLSTQFYNPHKESCVVRVSLSDRAPVSAVDQLVLVTERGGERRPAAERWWQHECGERIEVREGIAWVLSFAAQQSAADCARRLGVIETRELGLLCNPNSQDARFSGAEVPLPWIRASRIKDAAPGR